MSQPPFAELRAVGTRSLTANIVEGDRGFYLAAGAHQFGSLWTRDFCFAVRGLIAIGRDDVVRTHLDHLLEAHRTPDGLIARVLESVPSRRRVLLHTAFRFLPDFTKRFSLKGNLRAEYLGEHDTISIDANALVLRTALDLHAYHEKTNSHRDWLTSQRARLQSCLDFCLAQTAGGTQLVHQGSFEDWQDSATRSGKTCYTNVLFAIAFRAAERLGLQLPIHARKFQDLLKPTFFDSTSELYRSHENLPNISLDANLLLIGEELLSKDEAINLWHALKRHPLWRRAEIPGVATDPDYPLSWISWTTKVVGLTNYHDRLLWPWLSAYAAKAALCCDDFEEAKRIFSTLEHLAIRDGAISEVCNPTRGLPGFRTLLYVTEAPFSWAAGVALEALSSL